jgi:hypothetical protein
VVKHASFLGVTNSIDLNQGLTLEAAEKPEFFEGDGLQAVHTAL